MIRETAISHDCSKGLWKYTSKNAEPAAGLILNNSAIFLRGQGCDVSPQRLILNAVVKAHRSSFGSFGFVRRHCKGESLSGAFRELRLTVMLRA